MKQRNKPKPAHVFGIDIGKNIFHAAVLQAPFVKRRTTDRVLPAHIGQSQSAFNLAQNAHDLGLGKSALPHSNLLVVFAEKSLLSMPLSLGEDYPRELT